MEESTRMDTAGKIIKIVLTVSLFIVIAALIFRMCQASHKALEDTVITPAFKEAYKVDKDVRTHAVNDEFSENGAVWAYSLVYSESGGYLQITVRYNIRHIDEVRATYPEFKDESIRYELVDGKANHTSQKLLKKRKCLTTVILKWSLQALILQRII